MEEALQDQLITQRLKLSHTGIRNQPPDGTGAGDATTFELDHSGEAEHKKLIELF